MKQSPWASIINTSIAFSKINYMVGHCQEQNQCCAAPWEKTDWSEQSFALRSAPRPLREYAILHSVGDTLNRCSVEDDALQCTTLGTLQDASSESESYVGSLFASIATAEASGNGRTTGCAKFPVYAPFNPLSLSFSELTSCDRTLVPFKQSHPQPLGLLQCAMVA